MKKDLQALLGEVEDLSKSRLDSSTPIGKVNQAKSLHVDTSPAAGASHAQAFVRHLGQAGTDIGERLPALQDQLAQIRSGDLSIVEEMLFSQASTLQAIANQFAALGSASIGLNQHETGIQQLHIALRAQDQSRKTLLALVEVKNPKRATFIKANTAIGQQVNQLAISPSPQVDPLPLEASPHAPMDTGSQGATAATHPDLAAVELQHGTSNRGRKARKQPESTTARA